MDITEDDLGAIEHTYEIVQDLQELESDAVDEQNLFLLQRQLEALHAALSQVAADGD